MFTPKRALSPTNLILLPLLIPLIIPIFNHLNLYLCETLGSIYNRNEFNQSHSAIEGIFGQVAKTVVYGGAALARINNRLLCPLLKHETDRDNQDQPILYVFNDFKNKQRAFRIYADDEITPWMMGVAQFDPNQMTLIFVHGWLGGIHNEHWLTQAKNTVLEISEKLTHSQFTHNVTANNSNDNFRPNIIIVEWSDFALGSLYTATQNSLKVSRRLGRILGQLASVGGLKPELMHCMGHSIGTHICGQAARIAFPPKYNKSPNDQVDLIDHPRMGRITGLDPGGFCYELGIQNETTYAGLKTTDALVVDAYYSNRSPFGNKYKVADFNVRLNNGFFQKPCSVWKNPDAAVEYFKAAVRFSMGNIGNNDILTCDHYFATRFTSLIPSPKSTSYLESKQQLSCSYMSYACNSYRNFIRGRCGLCKSITQCYPIEFEYQRPDGNPSTLNALAHLKRYSSYLNHQDYQLDPNYDVLKNNNEDSDSDLANFTPSEYDKRRIYYMRIAGEEPFCNPYYRIRVNLNEQAIDASSFRSSWLKLKFYASSNYSDLITVKNPDNGKVAQSIGLYGPWSLNPNDMLETGLEQSTLTSLVEPQVDGIQTINSISVIYDNRLSSRQDPFANPIESINLDYISSTDRRIRNEHSRTFKIGQFRVIYKHLADEEAKNLVVQAVV